VADKKKNSPKKSTGNQKRGAKTRALIFEYVTDIGNIKLKTTDIAEFTGICERQVRRYLTNEFWIEVRDERRKRYAKHSVFVDEGLVRGAAKGNPAAARLYYEKHEDWIPRSKQEITGPGGGPIQTENTIITAKMSAKEAARVYARMIKEGNGE
jgi:hypothetical protein